MTIILSDKKCVACEGGTPPLTPEEIKHYQSQLREPWEVVDDKKIRKNFNFKDFKEAMSFVNKIANIAENEGHHPDIFIFYNQVRIELWTHAVGGLSENDFILAAKIEKI
ncbi:MAG: 4a-hydroxytetrahydrobiopterin dehydratase [Anaplasmataceae bacterium]|nr:4a-hydroxytetrahydrobiopterin dehydratase [Anaplasmataceae bacterium]